MDHKFISPLSVDADFSTYVVNAEDFPLEEVEGECAKRTRLSADCDLITFSHL
jgi:hypothetical protein